MAQSKSAAGFAPVVVPPKTRKGSGPKISREDCETVLDALRTTDPETGEFVWISNQIEYSSNYKAQAQALRYREAFAHYQLVEDVKDITSTVYGAGRNPETGEKELDAEGKEKGPFLFALKVKTE